MATDAEKIAALEAKVAAMEDLFLGVRNLLTAYARTQPKQTDLLPASVNGMIGSPAVAIRDELVATFERVTGRKYVFEGARDMAAVKKLATLKFELRGEIQTRWEECLKKQGFPGTQSIALFVTRINSFGPKINGVAHIVNVAAGIDPYSP